MVGPGAGGSGVQLSETPQRVCREVSRDVLALKALLVSRDQFILLKPNHDRCSPCIECLQGRQAQAHSRSLWALLNLEFEPALGTWAHSQARGAPTTVC